MSNSLTFEAISEAQPGPKWKSRWDWSWPAYEAWFMARGGDDGPTRAECVSAIGQYMPELLDVHARLTNLAGGGDRAARFLSGWCPPVYLGGCSLAAHSKAGEVRLVRNYDLSPDLNEGLLLRSEWTGKPVMGMVEFLWGLSDGINASGLCIALAFGGRGEVGRGFGVTTIVRYLLETCESVAEAIARLRKLPSHMAYNLVMADASGRVASVELLPGGGIRLMTAPVATNHQHGPETADRASFTKTRERRTHLEHLIANDMSPPQLRDNFLIEPLYQREYSKGFGTLFTADYDPVHLAVTLLWPGQSWVQSLHSFKEGVRTIDYSDTLETTTDLPDFTSPEAWTNWPTPGVNDWADYGMRIARLFEPRTNNIPEVPANFEWSRSRVTSSA